MSISTSNLPLYQPISSPSFSEKSNTGLWYDKFCDSWEPGWRKGLGKEGKPAWVKKFSQKYLGDAELLDEFAERRESFINACNGLALNFRTEGAMVSGLGRSHPVENGFSWHHILGVPYLPGSSVKGVVRSYARNWIGISDEEINRIFGPPQKSSMHRVGSVIFLDGIPILPVKLKAEVMTPHYIPYYTGSDLIPPGDWISPVPIPFLAVDEGQEFLFGVLPNSSCDQKDCDKASEWLSESLIIMGAGAKTSSGYGRFSKVELKDRGMRWLGLISRKKEMDIAEFLNESPKIAREEWMKIDDSEIKTLAARAIKREYQKKNLWDRPIGEKKKFKAALEEYFARISREGPA